MAQDRLDGRGDEMVIGPGVRLGTALGEAWQRAAFKAVWLLVGNWLAGLFLAWGLENKSTGQWRWHKTQARSFQMRATSGSSLPIPICGPHLLAPILTFAL